MFHVVFSAHTLILMVTADVDAVPGWNAGEGSDTWRSAVEKAGSLWLLQNKSYAAAREIKSAIKKKLKTPVPTR